jgi:hypothetical protein
VVQPRFGICLQVPNRPSAGVYRVHYSHCQSAGSQGSNTGELLFDVESISAVRRAVINLRGCVDPTGSEWVFQGHWVCDGHDPEGNVVQFQEAPQNSYTRADSVE